MLHPNAPWSLGLPNQVLCTEIEILGRNRYGQLSSEPKGLSTRNSLSCALSVEAGPQFVGGGPTSMGGRVVAAPEQPRSKTHRACSENACQDSSPSHHSTTSPLPSPLGRGKRGRGVGVRGIFMLRAVRQPRDMSDCREQQIGSPENRQGTTNTCAKIKTLSS